MNEMRLEINSYVDIPVDDVAGSIAEMDSESFGLFMNRVFCLMKGQCKTNERYEMQLCYIAKDIPKEFKHAIKDLNEYIELEEK